MPRSIESIMASHEAATQRRQEGRAIWDRTIRLGDVFCNEDMTFEERRDIIVRRIRRSGWLSVGSNITDLVEELGETEDVEEFDCVWDAIYDEADSDRVWIDTVSR